MAKYVYPAIFTEENNGLFAVAFPDVDGCFASGNSLVDAMEMAEDALSLMISYMEEKGISIPVSTPIKEIKTDENSFATLILCNTDEVKNEE